MTRNICCTYQVVVAQLMVIVDRVQTVASWSSCCLHGHRVLLLHLVLVSEIKHIETVIAERVLLVELFIVNPHCPRRTNTTTPTDRIRERTLRF